MYCQELVGLRMKTLIFFFVIVVFLISINVFHIDFSEYIGVVAVHYPIHLQLVSCYGFLA